MLYINRYSYDFPSTINNYVFSNQKIRIIYSCWAFFSHTLFFTYIKQILICYLDVGNHFHILQMRKPRCKRFAESHTFSNSFLRVHSQLSMWHTSLILANWKLTGRLHAGGQPGQFSKMLTQNKKIKGAGNIAWYFPGSNPHQHKTQRSHSLS